MESVLVNVHYPLSNCSSLENFVPNFPCHLYDNFLQSDCTSSSWSISSSCSYANWETGACNSEKGDPRKSWRNLNSIHSSPSRDNTTPVFLQHSNIPSVPHLLWFQRNIPETHLRLHLMKKIHLLNNIQQSTTNVQVSFYLNKSNMIGIWKSSPVSQINIFHDELYWYHVLFVYYINLEFFSLEPYHGSISNILKHLNW